MVTFYRLGGVAQNLSGQHTHIGPVCELGHLRFYPDMFEREKNGEIGLWN